MAIPTSLIHTFTPAGGPVAAVAAGQVLQDGQVDVAGNIWSINASNELVAGGSPAQGTSHLQAGTGQVPDAAEQRVVARILAVQVASTHTLAFRRQAGGDCYLAFNNVAQGRWDFFRYVGGSFQALGNIALASGYAVNDNLDYDVSCQGTTTVTFTLTVVNVTTSTTILNAATLADSSPPAGLQGSGGYALSTATGGDKFGRTAYYSDAVSGVTASAGAATMPLTAYAAVATGAAQASAGVATMPLTAYAASASAVSPATASAGAATMPLTAYPAAAAGTIAVGVTDAALTWSPYNWYLAGSAYRLTANAGAYVKFAFRGTQLVVAIDGSALPAAATLAWSIDGAANQSATVDSATTALTLATGLADATHTAVVWFQAVAGSGSLWSNPPPNALKITGFRVTGGAGGPSVSAHPTVYARALLVLTDSIGIGVNATSNASGNDATAAYPHAVGAALGCEVGVVGFGGQGYTVPGGAVPVYDGASAANTAWDKYFPSTSRLSGGLLTPTPTYALAAHGTNDGLAAAVNADVAAAATGLLAALRAAAGPLARLYLQLPPGRFARTALLAATLPDALSFRLDLGATVAAGLTNNTAGDGTAAYGAPPTAASYDGLHPSVAGHATIATALIAAIRATLPQSPLLGGAAGATLGGALGGRGTTGTARVLGGALGGKARTS